MPPSRTSTEDSVKSTALTDDLHPPEEWESIEQSINAEMLYFQNKLPQIQLETERSGSALKLSDLELAQKWESIDPTNSVNPAEMSLYEMTDEPTSTPTDQNQTGSPEVGQGQKSGKWTAYQEPKTKLKARRGTASQRLRENNRPRDRKYLFAHTDHSVTRTSWRSS